MHLVMTYFFPMKYMVKAFVILFIIADIGYHAFELERLDAQRQVLLDRILWDEEGWPYVDKLEPSYGAFRPVIK